VPDDERVQLEAILLDDEEMKLRDDDKRELEASMRAYVETHVSSTIDASVEAAITKQLGWAKIARLIRDGTFVFGVGAVVLTLLGFVLSEHSSAVSRREEDGKFQQKTDDRLSDIEKTLKNLQETTEDMRLKLSTRTASGPQSLKDVRQILNSAKSQNVPISETTIAETAQSFIAASQKTSEPGAPEAWGAALELAAYRTSLNIPPVGPFNALGTVHVDDDSTHLRVYGEGSASHDERAICRSIGGADELPDPGPATIIIAGPGTVHLDGLKGYEFKDVIFRNVKIRYTGGRVILRNVRFIDCIFDVPRSEQNAPFLEALTSSSQVSLTLG
jgi:hypothetical protein